MGDKRNRGFSLTAFAMIKNQPIKSQPFDSATARESGFALTELLISTVVVAILSAGIFSMLANVQSTSGYQKETLSVMENTRVAMSTLERYILQTGNNPRGAAFTPVTIVSETEVQLGADLTGSAGADLGDPDGDISDADENITIRYNQTNSTIELVTAGNTVQTLAQHISDFTLEYLDANGAVTTSGTNVKSIRVNISGSSTTANPQTGKTFGLTISGIFTPPNLG